VRRIGVATCPFGKSQEADEDDAKEGEPFFAAEPRRNFDMSARPRSSEDSPEGVSRRDFLKTAACGIAALSVGPAIFIPRRAEAAVLGKQVHPYIPGLRVVGIRDPEMVSELLERSSWVQQEKLARAETVANNIDKMACALARQRAPKDAWRKIFIKPPKKSWKETVVAVKTNQIATQRTRSAVMAKVCHVLTDVMGAKPANVFIYDACHGRNMSKNNPFKGLPEGCVIADRWGGSNTQVIVPSPWLDGKHKSPCLRHLVSGKVDILVNISLCKGHAMEWGGFTMAMKNHFGSFSPGPGHGPGGSTDYLIAINKTTQILGQINPKTGKVLFPRQQLCIVDALWASQDGPMCEADAQPNALFMGTFAPALDYQVSTQFRSGVMKWPVNKKVATRFLREFGISPKDFPSEGRIIDANKYGESQTEKALPG